MINIFLHQKTSRIPQSSNSLQVCHLMISYNKTNYNFMQLNIFIHKNFKNKTEVCLFYFHKNDINALCHSWAQQISWISSTYLVSLPVHSSRNHSFYRTLFLYKNPIVPLSTTRLVSVPLTTVFPFMSTACQHGLTKRNNVS